MTVSASPLSTWRRKIGMMPWRLCGFWRVPYGFEMRSDVDFRSYLRAKKRM